MFDDFDTDFNRAKKTFFGLFIFQGLLVIITVVAIIWGICYIMQHGLKGTVDRVWHGPTNQVTLTTNEVVPK